MRVASRRARITLVSSSERSGFLATAVSARVFLAYAAQIGRRRRVRGWRRPAWLRESLIVDVFYSARTSRYAKNSQCIDFEQLLRMRTYLAWTAYKIACVPPARFNPQP